MPFYRGYFHPGQLQFIGTSTYRRAPIFSSERLRRDFVEVLNHLRLEMQFLLVGWVLRPDHFHLLGKPKLARTSGHDEFDPPASEGSNGATHPRCPSPAPGKQLLPEDAGAIPSAAERP